MTVTGVMVAFGVLFIVGLCWFGLHYFANPPLTDPDGTAKITGNCGDTMEIALCFSEGTVKQTRSWTNGCAVSKQCVEAAVMLAAGKTPAEIRKINMMHIMDIVGQLPDTHLHCAQLAETTLQAALKDHIQHQHQHRCQSCSCR